MNLLADLGQGLRSAGGILDPTVYQGQRQEDALMQQMNEKRRDMMAQQIIKAAESGSMDPATAQTALQRLGLSGMPVGPDAHTQERIAKNRLDDGYRAAVERLGPDAPLEQQALVAAKFGKPEIAAQLSTALENRKQREQALMAGIQQKKDTLAQAYDLAQQRGADQRELAQMRMDASREIQQTMIAARQDMARLAASLRTPAQPPQPQIVQTENGPMQVSRTGAATPIIDTTTGQPVTPKSTEKAMPASAAKHLFENQQNLRRAEQAAGLIDGQNVNGIQGDPNATGVKGYLPEAVLQRTDKGGVDTRAAIADLGSLIIHDRSGAAVTAAEYPRLRPFIPQVTDDPAVVKKKLNRFVNEYRKISQETRDFYKESGFKVPDVLQPSGAAPSTGSPAGATGGWSIREK